MCVKKGRPIWLSILLWVLRTCLTIIILLSIFSIFLYYKYQINIFEVGYQLSVLNQKVNTERLLTNSYSNDDIEYVNTIISCDGNACSITETALNTINSTGSLKLSDKQVGALLNYIIEGQEEIKVQIGSEINLKEYGFKLMQVDFFNINDNVSSFNIVLKIELEKIKESMKSFPFNWLANYIPSELYFSSTVKIIHGEGIEYSTESESLLINNLTKEQTDNIFKTLNTFLKIGDSNEFNKLIGDTFVNSLIGNETAQGLVYGLYKENAVSSFNFEVQTSGDVTTEYFVIKK